MSTPLLPQVFWFRLTIPCRRVHGLPKGSKGRLLDLDNSCALPDTAAIDGKSGWADVRVAWNPGGLGVQVEAQKPAAALIGKERAEGMDGVNIWVDTRDTRNVSRATRFCHRFSARLTGLAGRGALGLEVAQRPIARAVADAPICRPDLIASRAERIRGGWRIELFLPAEALNGFDPDTNRRLGFSYQVTDPDREDQLLSVGREFPIGENPSLWSTLELRDE